MREIQDMGARALLRHLSKHTEYGTRGMECQWVGPPTEAPAQRRLCADVVKKSKMATSSVPGAEKNCLVL